MPASDCRSCVHVVKVLACKVKIEEQIYLSTAGKGLSYTSRVKLSKRCQIMEKMSNVKKSNMWTQKIKLT